MEKRLLNKKIALLVERLVLSADMVVGSAIGASTVTQLGLALGGPIGAIAGAIIGGILGGLLGPKSADNRAAANLTASGSISGSIFGKPTDETSQALTSAIGAIASGYDALKQLGGTINATVTSLHIGNRDKSEATLSNGQTVNAWFGGRRGGSG